MQEVPGRTGNCPIEPPRIGSARRAAAALIASQRERLALITPMEMDRDIC